MCGADGAQPRISIITPSLNQGAFLEKTIRSVLDQGYPDVEYIVIDGGSTDESVEILRRYGPRLAYWVSEPDRGQAHAVNKGLARATGEICAYINSDDYYLPGAFRAAAEALGRRGRAPDAPQWVAGAVRFLDEDGRLLRKWVPEPPPPDRAWCAICPWCVPQAGVFWRRSILNRFGTFREDMHYVFDSEFFVRLALQGFRPAPLERELAVAILHEDCKMRRHGDMFREEAARFYDIFAPLLNGADVRRARFYRRLLATRRSYQQGALGSFALQALRLGVLHPVRTLRAARAKRSGTDWPAWICGDRRGDTR